MHPISYAQAAVLGLLQGFSELFPISSLGHSVVLPRTLGWNIHQNDDYFLTFLVATHFATALVLFAFFFADWMRILAGMGRSLRDREIRDPHAKLGWLLVVGTIPAGLLGLALEHPLRSVFASAQSAAFFLMLNGVMLFGAERLRRRAPVPGDAAGEPDTEVAGRLSYRASLGIGAAQAIALVPGFSRSGASMSGGLVAGLSNEYAARFSFLLATPVIGAAALLKLPDLFGSKGDGVRGPAFVGALCAAVTAYLSVRFLMRFFETNRLTPFAWYCVVVGALLSIAFLIT
ncbi:MAG: undecaprenyl-diphosphate phosphatase [Solirubrobacteraceae bacterium]